LDVKCKKRSNQSIDFFAANDRFEPKAPDAAKRMKVGFCRSEKNVTKSKLDSPKSYWPKKYRPRL